MGRLPRALALAVAGLTVTLGACAATAPNCSQRLARPGPEAPGVTAAPHGAEPSAQPGALPRAESPSSARAASPSSEAAPPMARQIVEGSQAVGAAPHVAEPTLYARLRELLSVERSGYGATDYPGNLEEHIPKAYAAVLMAEVNRARMTGGVLSPQGIAAGKWLLDNADLNGDGVVGWGIPIAWDAYGDGTV